MENICLSYAGRHRCTVYLLLTSAFFCKDKIDDGRLAEGEGHGVKVGPGPRDPGTRDSGLPSKFKSGTPSPFFNEFAFFRIFHLFK